MMGLFAWFNEKDETQTQEICVERETDFSGFKEVTDYLYEKSGIIDLEKRALTASRLQQYAISQDVYSSQSLIQKMQNNPSFYQQIINIATVNETFFMREVKELEWLINYVKDSSKTFKILSMPCSSGEEIYSILLMMQENGVDFNRVEITGHDINSDAIARAVEGEYDEHSLHKINQKTRERHFTKNQNNHYEISSEIKRLPTFSQMNVFDLAGTTNEYDVILSRNMFIYFDETKRKKATEIIADALKPDGIYLKGHADQIYKHPNLKNVAFGVYKKTVETA